MDDPKIRQADSDKPVKVGDFLEAMKLLVSEIRGTANPQDQERLALEGERLLLEHERLKREMPENKQALGISVYSYPEGDLARPKPALKARIFWVGYEVKPETLTPLEIELLNRVEPGEYRVTKTDGTSIPFKVSAKIADNLKLEELAIWFPCKGEARHNHNSMTSYLQQALGDRIPSGEELVAEVARLRSELAARAH